MRVDVARAARARRDLANPRRDAILTDVAKGLVLSPRTLQRRLADDGLQFAAIADDVRRIEVVRLMSAKTAEIAVVAFCIGYRELDAARVSPARARRHVTQPPSP